MIPNYQIVRFQKGEKIITAVGERIKYDCGCITIDETSGRIEISVPDCSDGHEKGVSYNAPEWWKHTEFLPGTVSDDEYLLIGSREVWINCCYQVWVYRDVTKIPPVPGKTENDLLMPPEGMGVVTWLSIKLTKKKPIRDWRQFQVIKNLLLGPEVEAVELFPRESRLMDAANQYHLWCLEEGSQWPFGQLGRKMASPEEAAAVGAVQEPWRDVVHGLPSG